MLDVTGLSLRKGYPRGVSSISLSPRKISPFYERNLDRQDVINLFRFIDWCILLPTDLKQQFWQDLKDFEETRKMPFITSVEEIGIAKGEQIGFERGERSLVLEQLTELVGTLSPEITTQIQALPLPQIQALARALLRFKQFSDLQDWLVQHPQS
jgi:hypothetical protein